MAKIFLDANIFIDLVEKRKSIDSKKLRIHDLYLSPLSVHILTYLYKYKIPDERLADIDRFFKLVSFDTELTVKALGGPTSDFEDNIQLHSATEAECDIFLTNDQKLLKLKFFGKVELKSSLES
ncbi:PIN domain-containing protein [Candidatus Microgenomates bacterium]|nr:PIN domain-containing protein [Candidatus Microgenomates bacterium]